ncbi:MAG: T9SS type A sorting domain-containing protein [Bacteroidales bacterium]|nr:T9SS type A sorting domain-containing protein [Bacteroidales bacterium]
MIKNKVFKYLIVLVLFLNFNINKVLSQAQCVSASALTIGANDITCNSQTFTSLGPDFDDNTPPIIWVTNVCGVNQTYSVNWYSFTGDGTKIRIKIFNQNNASGFLVFTNPTCGGIMTASQCTTFVDDDLPHIMDINTINGTVYYIAVFRAGGASAMSGSICAFKTNGLPYSSLCDASPVAMTVKSKDVDCFSGYTIVSTTSTIAAPATPCASSSLDEWWFGEFTATSTETEIFLYGKDEYNASMEVLEGPCIGGMVDVFCLANSGSDRDLPNWGTMTTMPGKQYYVVIRTSSAGLVGRVCVYNKSAEIAKPQCAAGMSFEDGAGAGWQGRYGGWRLAWTPACNQFTWDTPNTPANFSGGRFMINSGTSRDPKIEMVPVVAPGGGNYSFRIGAPGAGLSTIGQAEGYSFMVPGDWKIRNHAASEAMEYCFTVDPNNAGFGYKYSCLMDNPMHNAVQQPYFEVYLYEQATGTKITCGEYQHWPGDGKSPFYYVGKNSDVSMNAGNCFTPWTDVLTDLSGFAGQTVCVIMRQKDCSGNYAVPNSPPWDSAEAGSHGVYTYFDTYCVSLNIEQPEFCSGDTSIQICAPFGYKSYQWDSLQSGLQSPFDQRCIIVKNPVAGYLYVVTVTSDSGCSFIKTVIFDNLPFTLTKDTIMCISESKILSASVLSPTNPPYNYSWSTGSSGSSIQISPAASTTYSVSVTNGNGCSSSQSVSVGIKSCNLGTNAINSSICMGNCYTINADAFGGTPPYAYTWNTGQNSSDIFICPTINETYKLTIMDNVGDTVTKSVTITVNSLPNVELTGDDVCIGQSTILSAENANLYTWNNNLGNGSSKTVSPTINTVYYVTGTNINGCMNTASVFINAIPLPSINITKDSIVCYGQLSVICASGASIYTWNTGGFTSCITATITGNSHIFYVTGTDVNGCRNVASCNIKVYPPPYITATGGIINSGDCITITSSGSSVTYTWNTSETGSAISVCPSVATMYYVTGTDINGCTNNAYAVVQVTTDIKDNIEKYSGLFIIPNPAKDEVNIIFSSDYSKETEIKIINFNGQIIYSEKAENFKGKYNKTIDVSRFSEGVYFVQIVNTKNILTRKLVLIK